MMSTTKNSRDIAASQEVIYKVLTSPEALPIVLVPGEMTAKMLSFDLRVGGGYEMSLFYPESDKTARGKTTAHEDRYKASFLELKPYEKIVESIKFDAAGKDFEQDMIIEITLEPKQDLTTVTFLFRNIPAGIRPEDNEAGTLSTLEKLAAYVE